MSSPPQTKPFPDIFEAFKRAGKRSAEAEQRAPRDILETDGVSENGECVAGSDEATLDDEEELMQLTDTEEIILQFSTREGARIGSPAREHRVALGDSLHETYKKHLATEPSLPRFGWRLESRPVFLDKTGLKISDVVDGKLRRASRTAPRFRCWLPLTFDPMGYLFPDEPGPTEPLAATFARLKAAGHGGRRVSHLHVAQKPCIRIVFQRPVPTKIANSEVKENDGPGAAPRRKRVRFSVLKPHVI